MKSTWEKANGAVQGLWALAPSALGSTTSHGQPTEAHAKRRGFAIPGDLWATREAWLKGHWETAGHVSVPPWSPQHQDSHDVLLLVLLGYSDALTTFLQLMGCHLAQNLHVLDEVQL